MFNLRKELYKITKECDIEQHPLLIENLKKQKNHNIKLVQQYNKNDFFIKTNCFMHALKVHDNQNIINILRSNGEIIFGTNFIKRLIDRKIIVSNKNGTLIVYFADKEPKHAGLIINNYTIISKWGTGHKWQHDIWEVPSLYGDKYELFDPIPSKKIEDEFIAFSNL